ncbi:MAG: CatB-related O-acetyltransferase [bacterium]|nr:CatB-related O-acetyltransferase [bacterium]
MNDIITFGNVKITNSTFGQDCRAYDGSEIMNSKLGDKVSIGNDTNIINCNIHNNIAINRRCYVNNTEFGDFSYCGINCVINFTKIGKFCSIARNVDIGGFNHDYTVVSTMPEFRFEQLFNNNTRTSSRVKNEYCNIGNDVWIAAGVHILHNVTIGDGAVIGAGAVVTKDVEPYTIIAGLPAKPMKKRFEQKYIDDLLDIQWWNWPTDTIKQNIDLIIHTKMNGETIKKLKEIASNLKR